MRSSDHSHKLIFSDLESHLWASAGILRGNMDTERQSQADDLGLSERGLVFYNLLKIEVTDSGDGIGDEISKEIQMELIRVNIVLVKELAEVTKIVDSFRKEDEIKKVKQSIKRLLMKSTLPLDMKAKKRIGEKFINLAKVSFGK